MKKYVAATFHTDMKLGPSPSNTLCSHSATLDSVCQSLDAKFLGEEVKTGTEVVEQIQRRYFLRGYGTAAHIRSRTTIGSQGDLYAITEITTGTGPLAKMLRTSIIS